MDVPQITLADLGLLDYQSVWQVQEALLEKALKIKAKTYQAVRDNESINTDNETTENYLIFCSHPHVYTLGKSGSPANLLLSDAELQLHGIEYVRTNRGGDITYHGPGQIVGYPVLDLEYFFTDLGKYMRSLEEVIIRTIAEYGIVGERLTGATGVWLEPDTPRARKICAMGVKSSRWVTIHGFALNVNTDLSFFSNIIPCGIADKGVTSMEKELGCPINESDVKAIIRTHFAAIFEADIIEKPIPFTL
jgi:lipoyl(octanoyl) transferase